MDIKIKKLEVADIDNALNLCSEIRDYHIKLLGGYFKPINIEGELESLREMVSDQQAICLVAKADNQVIGLLFAAIRHLDYMENPDICHIHNFGVTEKYRKLGIGKMLMNEMLNLLKNTNIRRITLGLFLDNKIALNFYEEFGFKPFEQKMVLNLD